MHKCVHCCWPSVCHIHVLYPDG